MGTSSCLGNGQEGLVLGRVVDWWELIEVMFCVGVGGV